MALAGCETSSDVKPGNMPPVPGDIQACFRQGPGVIPDRALSIYDVESLWKQDRIKVVVMQKCGARLISWYNALRK
jgi:hypothetical protein